MCSVKELKAALEEGKTEVKNEGNFGVTCGKKVELAILRNFQQDSVLLGCNLWQSLNSMALTGGGKR